MQIKLEKIIDKGQLLIDGQWCDARSGISYATYNPATEEVITDLASAGIEDLDVAVSAAKRAFHEVWKPMPASQKAIIMNRIADLIDLHAKEIAYLESIEMGKLYLDALYVDLPHIANAFRYFAGWASKLEGKVKPVEAMREGEQLMAFTVREPLGVVGAITPFNFPVTLSVNKIATALAAGNTIVHKPAQETSLSIIKIAKLMIEAGLPAGVFNLITGPGAMLGDAMSVHPCIDKIAITGSTQTGKRVIQRGAETLKHVTVELGGKSPNIIFADADLDKAVEIAVNGIFWNKGEVCVAGSRILVEESIYNEFVERFVARTKQIKVGNPLNPGIQMGPMSSQSALEKSLEYVEIGKKEGARLCCGGEAFKINGKGHYITPAVFADATNDMRISQEEIFGPIVPIIPFSNFKEAIKLANETPYGLASGVQTRDVGKGLRAARLIEAGIVWINTWHYYSVAVPFGGCKQSGYGRELGYESFDSYTQSKTVWVDLGK